MWEEETNAFSYRCLEYLWAFAVGGGSNKPHGIKLYRFFAVNNTSSSFPSVQYVLNVHDFKRSRLLEYYFLRLYLVLTFTQRMSEAFKYCTQKSESDRISEQFSSFSRIKVFSNQLISFIILIVADMSQVCHLLLMTSIFSVCNTEHFTGQ
jgi:hypothetical protein